MVIFYFFCSLQKQKKIVGLYIFRSYLCEKWAPKCTKEKHHVHIVSRTCGPEKIKNYDASGVLFKGLSGKL